MPNRIGAVAGEKGVDAGQQEDVEYTVTQFVQLRAFYRFRDDVETSPRDDESELDFEIHLFF